MKIKIIIIGKHILNVPPYLTVKGLSYTLREKLFNLNTAVDSLHLISFIYIKTANGVECHSSHPAPSGRHSTNQYVNIIENLWTFS